MMRVTTLGFVSIAALGLAACTATGKVSIGDDAKVELAASDIKAAKSECTTGKHPNICCRDTACYAWLDDPFRACDFGFQTISDGKKCCTSSDPASCAEPPSPPEAPPVPPPEPPKGPEGSPLELTAGKCVSILHAFSGPSTLVTVDLATGVIERGPAVTLTAPDITSLGVIGKEVFFCERDGDKSGSVKRVSLADGTTTSIPLSCDAVTTDAKGIWVLDMFGRSLTAYESFDGIREGKQAIRLAAPSASRLGNTPSGLVAAWHSADEILRLGNNGAFTPTKLAGYDGWIWGVSGDAAGRLIVSSPVVLGGQAGLVAFDAAGKNLGLVAKAPADSMGFSGLACAL